MLPTDPAPSVLDTLGPSGVAAQIASRIDQPHTTPAAGVDWSQAPATADQIDPQHCDPAALEVLPAPGPDSRSAAIAFCQPHTLVVAVAEPPTQAELDELRRLSGHEIRPITITNAAAHRALVDWATRHTPEVLELNATVEILLATGSGSDLHLTVGDRPWLRVGGQFAPAEHHRRVSHHDIVTLMTQARPGFDLVEFDGDLDLSFAAGGERWRANLANERGHLVLTIRKIPSKIPNARDLGVPAKLMQLQTLTQGLVVVAGPTGSGKSTTLAAFVDAINTVRDEHILTIERPIEFVHRNKRSKVTQREIETDTESLQRAIKSALRQDPDVVLVGEARDYEEIQAAITLAETGHLVLMTLHASSAEGVIDRIVDVFPSEQQNQIRTQLAGSLRAVLIQQLLPDANDPTRRHLGYEFLSITPAVRAMLIAGKSKSIAAEITTSSEQIAFEDVVAQHVAHGRVSHAAGSAAIDDAVYFADRVQYHEQALQRASERGVAALESIVALIIVAAMVTSLLITIGRASGVAAGQVARSNANAVAAEVAGKAEAFSCGTATGAEPLFADTTSAAACASIGANLDPTVIGAQFDRGGDTFAARVDQEWIRPVTAAACADLTGLNPRLVNQTVTVRWVPGGGPWEPAVGPPPGFTVAELGSLVLDAVIAVPDRAPYLPSSSRTVVVTGATPGTGWTITPAGGEPVTQAADANGCVWFPWLPPTSATLASPASTTTVDLTAGHVCISAAGAATTCARTGTVAVSADGSFAPPLGATP